MPIASKTAKIAILTSSCRLPPGLLAAGMPLEFRLALHFMPTDYGHLHQTVKFRSINSVPPRSDQHWRMGSPWFFSYLTYILDLVDASFPHLCWRFYDGLYVILRFMAAPTREMRHSLWLTHLTTLPILTCLAMRRTGGPRPSHALCQYRLTIGCSIFYRRVVTNAPCASGELHQ